MADNFLAMKSFILAAVYFSVSANELCHLINI